MTMIKHLLFLIFIIPSFFSLNAQSKRPVYVIVHGAWGGGWAFKTTDSLLTSEGNTVYRPTLTGLGERVHLAHAEVGLNTHITDIVNTILFEDLHEVILIGHSYGGMVVAGVADSIPERIRKLIYVDAFVPENGESLWSIVELTGGNPMKDHDGFLIPPWVAKEQKPPKDVPHPLKTMTDKLRLDNPLRDKIPTYYIHTVKEGTDPAKDDFATQADRAKKRSYPVYILHADHNPQWSAPEAFARMLSDIAGE
jgi:pimeloyl-ACP methyl ester carboxylesterase